MIAWGTHPGVIEDEGAGALVRKCCQPWVEGRSLAVNALAFWICVPRESVPWTKNLGGVIFRILPH